jgi:hypothetical protein
MKQLKSQTWTCGEYYETKIFSQYFMISRISWVIETVSQDGVEKK